MPIEVIQAALSKTADLSREDLRVIEVELALMPLDEAHEAEPGIREALWQIIADPSYAGELTIADLNGL